MLRQFTHYILLLFSFFPLAIFAQDCDSPACLLSSLKNSTNDTNRIRLLDKVGSYYLNKAGENKSDLDSAMLFFKQALQQSDALHSMGWKLETLQLIATCFLEKFDMPHGKEAFMEAINYYRKSGDKTREIAVWTRMGNCIPFDKPEMLNEKAHCFENLQLLFHQLHDTLNEIEAIKNLADMRMNQGQLDIAEQGFQDVLARYRAIKFPQLQYTYDLLAIVNKFKGNLDKTLYYHLEAVKFMEKSGDTREHQQYFYLRLANIFFELSDFNKSLFYYNKVMAVKPGDRYYRYAILSAISGAYIGLGKPVEALSFLQDSIKRQPPEAGLEKMYIEAALGNCYMSLHQYNKAEKTYLELVRITDSLYKYGSQVPLERVAKPYRLISNLYVETKQYKKAAFYLDKLLVMPSGIIASQHWADIHLMKFKTDSAAGNYVPAIEHFEIHKKITDSIFNATKTKQISELQIKYETGKKDNELLLKSKNIQLLTNQTKLQQSQVIQSRLTRNAVMGGAVLLLVLLAVGYSRYRLKQQKNLQLEIKQKEITSKNTKLEKLLHENEWLLREVHHRVKNNLQIIMSLLNSQSAYLKDEAALSAMLESQQRVQSMSLIHQKLYKSSNVSTIYMPEYIQEMVDYLKDSFKTRNNIYFDLQVEPIDLDVLQAVPIGLILNEVITNSMKYAFPHSDNDKITIVLSRRADRTIFLVMKDNGRGLPADFDLATTNSFGMILINGLAEDLEGTCDISSAKGTSVIVTFNKTTVAVKETTINKELFVV